MRGVFISIEGGEGSGKSTQLAMLADALKKSGTPHIITREPGGSVNAESIRKLLVSGDHEPFDPIAETLLFYAARAEHVQKIVRPALAKNKAVICDRFVDSTIVYQGIAKGLGENYIRMLHQATLGNFMPDLTLILDIDPQAGLARAADRKSNETRFEEMDIAFHRAIRTGFLAIAQREPQRCVVIDAAQDKNALHAHIMQRVMEKIA